MRFGSIVKMRLFLTAAMIDEPDRAATSPGFGEYGSAARTMISGSRLWIDDENIERRGLELFDRPIGEFHAEDEVGLERDDLLEVHLDAADMLSGRGFRGLVREVVHADDTRAGAECEEKRGDRWANGN